MVGANDTQTALTILSKRTIALWPQETLLIPARLLGMDGGMTRLKNSSTPRTKATNTCPNDESDIRVL